MCEDVNKIGPPPVLVFDGMVPSPYCPFRTISFILKAVISWLRASKSHNRVMIALFLNSGSYSTIVNTSSRSQISLIPYGLSRNGFLALILRKGGVSQSSSDLSLLNNHLKNTLSNCLFCLKVVIYLPSASCSRSTHLPSFCCR